MNKKLIAAILCLSFMIVGVIPTQGMEIPDDLEDEDVIFDEYLKLMEDENVSFGSHIAIISGPVTKFISKIKFLDGDENQINRIKGYLNRKPSILKRILPFVPIRVTNLTFTVEFRIPLRLLSRFHYYSFDAGLADNKSNDTKNIFNYNLTKCVKHKITVENLNGRFFFDKAEFVKNPFKRGKNFFFQPARFVFSGFCEKVSYNTTELF